LTSDSRIAAGYRRTATMGVAAAQRPSSILILKADVRR